jgi:nicotinamidase-related amidase
LTLPVRYYQDSTPVGVPCREENFERREIDMDLPVEQTALVLIDLWHNHFIDSWIERAGKVLREQVLPAIDAARLAGLPIIHAPCPEVAAQYDQLGIHAPPEPSRPAPEWPPQEFRRREGEWHAYRGPREQEPGIRDIREDRRVSDVVEVRPDDIVIATGEQLHTWLASKGILHIIFAGFATNWCIINRDYGVRAMRNRGYNTILLRDATTGVEFPDTLDGLWATELSIREVEQKFGFSASNPDFFTYCNVPE